MKRNLLVVLFVCTACLLACTKELAPVGSAVFTVNNSGCEAPCEVSFSAADGSIRYRWDFGDGSAATGQTAKKAYANAGSYTVKLVVSGEGGSAISSQPVNIQQKPIPSTREYLPGVSFTKMVLISGGTFQMGDTRNEGDSDEKPVHTVTVSSFYMGQYEATQRQWQNVMGSNPANFKGCDDCPVEQVSHDDIQVFLSKLNSQRPANTPAFRLPTEAEWEYAAGGGAIASRNRFGNGKDVANPAEINYNGSDYTGRPTYSVAGVYRNKTTQVGSFAPNALGLYDMSGNVYEWCSDWYGSYSSAAQVNPTGPNSGLYRVLRSGSWYGTPPYCRSALRGSFPPAFRNDGGIGFRIVSSLQ